MQLIKKTTLLLLFMALVSAPVQGGLKFRRAGAPGKTHTRLTAAKYTVADPLAKQRQQTLNQRVTNSFWRAVHSTPELPSISTFEVLIPLQKAAKDPYPLKPKHMYPDKPFLQHPTQGTQLAEAYFFAQHNRLLRQHVLNQQALRARLIKEIPRLRQQSRQCIQVHPKDLVTYTAQQISGNIQNLFIGEMHGYDVIPQFVAQLLIQLREQYPEREIFFFTEFIDDPASKGTYARRGLQFYQENDPRADLWQTASAHNIPVVGLEPGFVSPKLIKAIVPPVKTSASVTTGASLEVPLWATLEGTHIRNEHWWGILQKYRAQHPDALFITYTGAAHSYYNFPFSLAARTPKETTFMLDLMPRRSPIVAKDNLEGLLPELSFPQTVLKWDEPDLGRLTGFDMRIKLPEITKR